MHVKFGKTINPKVTEHQVTWRYLFHLLSIYAFDVWTNKFIYLWEFVTQPCLNYQVGSAETEMESWYGWVIAS